MPVFNETYKLENGVEIPKLALGTWLIENGKAEGAVKTAIDLGYRHIDTAQAYGNEQGVGSGVRASGVNRSDIFVTSKVAAENKSYKSAAESIDKSLLDSGLDYFDLMLIHSPQPWAEVNKTDNRYYEGNREAWRALEDALKAGKLRSIGVSNFLKGDIENLAGGCSIMPMVNQVLAHIANTPFELIDYCKNKNIIVEAYSPVAHGEALRNEQILQMAQKYNVSVAQLCIKYDLQLGLVVLPKASSANHMSENAELDFEISDFDMKALKNMQQGIDYGESGVFPVFGGKL